MVAVLGLIRDVAERIPSGWQDEGNNIYLLGTILGVGRRQIARVFDDIVAFSELESVIDTPVKLYSSGMGMRLGFATVVHLAPRILLVDEALAVGDIAFQRRCLRRMREYVRDGGCVVLVTHDVVSAFSVCQRAVVLDGGRVAFDGAVEQAAMVYQDAATAAAARAPTAATRAAPGEMRYGTGGAELLRMQAWSDAHAAGDDDAPLRLLARAPATIRVLVQAASGVDDAQVGISVWDVTGESLLMLNTQGRNVRVPALRAGQTIAVEFRFHCPLAPGRYRLGAGVFSPAAGDFLDRRLNWRTLEVVAPHAARSLIDIAYEVSIDMQPATETQRP